MSKLFQWVNVILLCSLALVLSSELLVQSWRGASFLPGARDLYAQQTGSIYVDRDPKSLVDPVAIVKVTESGREIVQGVYRVPPNETPGEPIPASDDWINNLAFTLKNLTKLNIEYMAIDISFLYGDRSEWGHVVPWNINLGQVPPAAVAAYFKNLRPGQRIPVGTGHPLEFGPDQEMTISLSGLADSIKARIEALTPLSSVTTCVIGVGTAYFDQPGLRWGNYGFGWVLPDQNSPTGYKKLEKFFPGDLSHPTFDEHPPHQWRGDSGSN